MGRLIHSGLAACLLPMAAQGWLDLVGEAGGRWRLTRDRYEWVAK